MWRPWQLDHSWTAQGDAGLMERTLSAARDALLRASAIAIHRGPAILLAASPSTAADGCAD
jgi:hypothetical protein